MDVTEKNKTQIRQNRQEEYRNRTGKGKEKEKGSLKREITRPQELAGNRQTKHRNKMKKAEMKTQTS